MLDGFDEIDSRGRKSVIQLIKAITENESVRIYVATRPHTVDELQLELSQLAFFLAPFNEEDQIKCLVNFWENKIPNLQDEENKKLKDYAKTLARKVNMTEDDRDLIGIPLQCRVVAECFLQQAKREVKQSTEEEEEDQMHFDLAGLYERLMQTKRRVFLEEKLKLGRVGSETTTNPTKNADDAILQLCLAETLKNIQRHLLKLAIETIFHRREDVDIFWPCPPLLYQSDADGEDERERLDKLSISYGLTDRNGQGKMEFLHRTYAEYLVADYIYQGFLPDEKLHNKLLEEESTRDFIKKVIFKKENRHGMLDVQKECEGVVTFLNSKLRRLVESEKWRDLVNKCSNSKEFIPNRLQKIVVPTYFVSDDLCKVAESGKWNIFIFICDCLDATFHKIKVREVIIDYLNNDIYHCTNFVATKRCFQYFDDPNPNPTEIKNILSFIFGRKFYLILWQRRRWQEDKEILRLYFQFLKKYRKFMEIYLRPEDKTLDLLNLGEEFFATCSDDSETREICIDLLSIYEREEFSLARLDQETKYFWPAELINGFGMENMLTALRDVGRNETLKGMSQLVFAWRPDVYKRIYQPIRPTIDDVSTDIQSLTTRDSLGLTILHRAAFYGETQVVMRILETFRQNLDDKQVMDLNTPDDNKLTQLLIVASIGRHEETCRLLLKFLKEVHENQFARELTTDRYMFIKESLKAMRKYERVNSIKFFLKCVKEGFGQTYLIGLCEDLRQSIFPDRYEHNTYFHTFIEPLLNIIFLEDTSDLNESYNFLSKLFLSEQRAFHKNRIKQIDPEIICGMLDSLGDGLFNWIRRFVDSEARN